MNKAISAAALVAAVVLTSTVFAASVPNDQCEDEPIFKSGLSAFVNGDDSKAARIFNSLAQAGDACGQFWLGKLYSLGRGVHMDQNKSIELMKMSAAQGYSKARLALFMRGIQ